MSAVEAFSIATSAFSILLALFAIWVAFQQRKESQQSYENTKDVLAEIEKVLEKTQMLVSENYQNLLTCVTDQQKLLLDSLKPKPTSEEKYTDLVLETAVQRPDKLEAVVAAISKVSQRQQYSVLNREASESNKSDQ
ncbi:MAG: hypothetical protein ACJ74Q_12040 [Pyrinomonadaceae bacterium]